MICKVEKKTTLYFGMILPLCLEKSKEGGLDRHSMAMGNLNKSKQIQPITTKALIVGP